MKAEQLRKAILQMAIQGKLVPQDSNDEPASVLLEKIRAEKQRLIKEGKIKKDKVDSIIFKGEDNRHYEKVGNEVKDITEEIDFDLPDGWEYIRLSTICWLDDIKATSGEKLPYWDAKALRGKSDKNYITSGKVIESGTKIILVDGENSGEVFDVPFRGYMGSTFKILGASNNINIDYLSIVLDFYRDVFKGNKIGAAIPHLNKNLFKSLLIGLPPIKEQARIVSELIKYEPLTAEYDKLEQQKSKLDSEIYDKLKKSILQYAIQGKLVPQYENDEPASELLKRIRAEKKEKLGKKYVDSYIYKGDDNCYYEHIDGKAQDEAIEVPFDLPDNWAWAHLSQYLDVRDGTHDTPKYVDTGFPLITSKNLQNGNLDFTTAKLISKTDLDNINMRSYVDSGDILFAMIGSIGNPVKVIKDREFAIKNMALFKPFFEKTNMDYVLYFLLFTQEIMKSQSSGAVQQFVSLNYLREYLIPIPSHAEQQRIVNKINEIFAKL